MGPTILQVRRSLPGRSGMTKGLGVFALAILSFRSQAAADTLTFPDTAAAASVTQADGTSLCDDHEEASAVCSAAGASATVAVLNGLGGTASASAGTDMSVIAVAMGGYSFTVTGPAGATVPILITGSTAFADNGASNFAGANLIVTHGTTVGGLVINDTFFGTAYGCSVIFARAPDASCDAPGSFSVAANVTSGEFYGIGFSADAFLGDNASAMIDPLITIDPAFAQASQFGIAANPGVLPVGNAVPEPGEFALVGFALAFIGALRVRSQRQASSVVAIP